jgi:hypothetical protein
MSLMAANFKFVQSQIIACGRTDIAKILNHIKYLILEL